MKVCIWAKGSFEQWYSSYHLMLAIVNSFLEAEHDVYLVQSQYEDGRLPEELLGRDKLHVINVPSNKAKRSNFVSRYIKSIQYYKKTGKIIKRLNNIDAIFLASNNSAFIPIKIANKLKIPIVYNVQDIFPIDAMVIGKLSKWNPAFVLARKLQAYAYKNASRVVTISEDLAKTIREEGRNDVDVIYNWSYQNEPYDIPDENNHFLLTNNIRREDGFRVVYAGNIGQMMDNEMIIQSAKLLKDKTDIKFYIIGGGSGLKRFKARIEEEELTNILLFGFQPMEYAQDNYCAADININPVPKGVMYTCMPSKTATCLLSQKPTVVSMDLDSDMAKRLSTVDQWTVVAPGDAQAMANAILKVYREGSRKSENAAKFLQELGPVENAREYVKIIECIVK
ncbi:MAG: glycosyltransferase family 4 protein [Lachnospiraceae bacterium]|nr:glycosyltransferase family 4 protein [Lachnospiraceae bacterium]